MAYESGVSVSALVSGCCLAAIAHAVAMVKYPDLSNEHSWNGVTYSTQDGAGSRTAVTFGKAGCVGAVYYAESSRDPARNVQRYDLQQFFLDAPPEMRALANEEALQYLLDDLDGDQVPVITAAFWQSGQTLVSAEPWEVSIAEGLRLLSVQMEPVDIGLSHWVGYYDFNDRCVMLTNSVLNRYLANNRKPISLTLTEASLLTDMAIESALDVCRESFAELSIDFP